MRILVENVRIKLTRQSTCKANPLTQSVPLCLVPDQGLEPCCTGLWGRSGHPTFIRLMIVNQLLDAWKAHPDHFRSMIDCFERSAVSILMKPASRRDFRRCRSINNHLPFEDHVPTQLLVSWAVDWREVFHFDLDGHYSPFSFIPCSAQSLSINGIDLTPIFGSNRISLLERLESLPRSSGFFMPLK